MYVRVTVNRSKERKTSERGSCERRVSRRIENRRHGTPCRRRRRRRRPCSRRFLPRRPSGLSRGNGSRRTDRHVRAGDRRREDTSAERRPGARGDEGDR